MALSYSLLRLVRRPPIQLIKLLIFPSGDQAGGYRSWHFPSDGREDARRRPHNYPSSYAGCWAGRYFPVPTSIGMAFGSTCRQWSKSRAMVRWQDTVAHWSWHGLCLFTYCFAARRTRGHPRCLRVHKKRHKGVIIGIDWQHQSQPLALGIALGFSCHFRIQGPAPSGSASKKPGHHGLDTFSKRNLEAEGHSV